MTNRIVHREYDGEHTSGGPDCACQPETVEVMLDALFDEVRELQASIAEYDDLIDEMERRFRSIYYDLEAWPAPDEGADNYEFLRGQAFAVANVAADIRAAFAAHDAPEGEDIPVPGLTELQERLRLRDERGHGPLGKVT